MQAQFASEFRIVHQQHDRAGKCQFVIRWNKKGGILRGNSGFLKVEANYRLTVRHVLHDLDPGRYIVEGTRGIGINTDIGGGKIFQQLLIRNESREFDAPIEAKLAG